MGNPIRDYCYVLVSSPYYDVTFRMFRQESRLYNQEGELLQKLNWANGKLLDSDEMQKWFAEEAGCIDCLYINFTGYKAFSKDEGDLPEVIDLAN